MDVTNRLADFANILANEKAELVDEAANMIFRLRACVVAAARFVPSEPASTHACMEVQAFRRVWLRALEMMEMTEAEAVDEGAAVIRSFK